MATPSKNPASSTPRTANLTPTSVRKMVSPRPVTAGKSLASKSPAAAMKTPASAHSHNISTSSQPSNTPLLAHAFTEGAVNLDSPSAALMGFSNSHGLTPLPPSLDGLGVQSHTSRHSAGALPRNAEADKMQRLQQTISLLKSRATGRGITREGVVKIAQSNGFTTYWDEDLLTVAGNLVDLEIMFGSEQKDSVKDVVLKISASGSEERQEEASEILKRDLAQLPAVTAHGPWNVLNSFADNIARLRQLDKLSDGVNCFDAVDGLYGAFKQVWEEEKKRLTWRSELQHLCLGTVGRARMNKRQRLGVGVDYWSGRHEVGDTLNNGLSTVLSDNASRTSSDDTGATREACWTALISCEAGYSPLRVSRGWLSSEILTGVNFSEELSTHEVNLIKPAWKTLNLSDEDEVKHGEDQAAVDAGSPAALSMLNAHFTFTLDPVVYLPTNVFASLGERGLVFSTNPPQATSYAQMLGHSSSYQRWPRSLTTYDGNGSARVRKHSYWLSGSDFGCVPVSTVGFLHPRDLTDLLPTLRQHALLWSMLQKLTPGLPGEAETIRDKDPRHEPGQRVNFKADAVRKRSNLGQVAKLDNLLASRRSQEVSDERLPVDITLSFAVTVPLAKPKIDVIVPLSKPRNGLSKQAGFCSASFEIEENGKLVMHALRIPDKDAQETKSLGRRVLALSEDIGALAEWMLDQANEGR